jgi:hypothetical protein
MAHIRVAVVKSGCRRDRFSDKPIKPKCFFLQIEKVCHDHNPRVTGWSGPLSERERDVCERERMAPIAGFVKTIAWSFH